MAGTTEKKWFEKTRRSYLLDVQMPDPFDQTVLGQPEPLQNFDVARIVDELARVHVDAIYVHAHDNQGNSYYNTKVSHKNTAIGDRDLMAEFSEACRQRNMTILYYVQLSRQRRSFEYDAHKARNEDGSPVLFDDKSPRLPSLEERPVVCMNGPHREYLLAILRELSANYDFDGYWLDCFGWWGRVECCYCDTCKAKYYEDTGRSLPHGPRTNSEEWRLYLIWRQRLNLHIYRELTDAIRDINPHHTITHNGATHKYNHHGFYALEDYVSHEFHYDEGLGNLSLQCRKQESLKHGNIFEVEIWRFFNRLSDTLRGYQIRPLPMHLVEMASVLAHGGFVQYYDQINMDGTLPGRSLEVLKPAFEWVRNCEPFLGDDKYLDYASLVWSHSTDVYATAEQATLHKQALEGAHHALMENHLPIRVLNDDQVMRGEFGETKVLVLPNVVCMSDEEIDQIDDFVQNGGGLVVTYRSSMCDATGRHKEQFGLSDILGIDYVEPISYLYSYIQADHEHPVTQGVALGFPMILWKLPQVKVRQRDGETLGRVVNPMRGFHMGHPPLEVLPFPSISIHQYGKGRVVYFSAPIDAVYAEYGHPDYRNLLANAVRWAAGEAPLVEAQAPLGLEIVPRQSNDGKRLTVHLLNRVSAGRARAKSVVVEETIPIPNLVIHVNDARYTQAALQPGNRPVSLTKSDGQVTVTIPEVRLHDILVLE